jgi:hypothetical protein
MVTFVQKIFKILRNALLEKIKSQFFENFLYLYSQIAMSCEDSTIKCTQILSLTV